MTKHEILQDIYRSAEITEVVNRIQPEHIRDDLKQHVFLLLLEKTDEFIIGLYSIGKLKNYIVKVICQLVNFKEDKFHRANRRSREILIDFQNIQIIDNTGEGDTFGRLISPDATMERKEKERMEDICVAELEKIYPYNQELLRKYIEFGNYRKVAEWSGIPVMSVYDAIKTARKQLKKNVLCRQ